jgi:hypothetical protein
VGEAGDESFARAPNVVVEIAFCLFDRGVLLRERGCRPVATLVANCEVVGLRIDAD